MFDIPRRAPEIQEPTNQPPGWLEAQSEIIKKVVALASAGGSAYLHLSREVTLSDTAVDGLAAQANLATDGIEI